MSSNKKIRKAIKAAEIGKQLSSGELRDLKKELGVSSGIRGTARDLGIKIGSKGGGLPEYNVGTEFGTPGIETDYTFQSNLLKIQGNIDVDIAKLNREAAESVANIGLEGTKYTADREKEAALGVEGIRTQGALDLQQIVNAGNREVENIRGEFGLKGKQIDRSTAILGGLVNAFNFS